VAITRIKRRRRLGLAEEVMNITIFCKEEEDEERDAPVANCEEGPEEASAAAASPVVFFFFLSGFVLFLFQCWW
jgi:hypothetical protein